MKHLHFIDTNGGFTLDKSENTSYLYFPLASETGLKCSVTPNLGGDASLSQNSFILEPVSSENLHNNRSVRNFWCTVDGTDIYSVAGVSPQQEADKFSAAQDNSTLTAGFMHHTIERISNKFQIASSVTFSQLSASGIFLL